MRSYGFTLIELVIYMLLFSVLGLLVFSWNSTIGSFFDAQGRIERMIVEEDVALDVIRRDIMSAHPLPLLWHQEAATFGKEVLNGDTYAVGYSIHDDTLYRSDGTYDFMARRWLKKTTQVMTKNIRSIQMVTYRLQGVVIAVKVLVTRAEGGETISLLVELRNRMV